MQVGIETITLSVYLKGLGHVNVNKHAGQSACKRDLFINRQSEVSDKMADRENLLLAAMLPSLNLTLSNVFTGRQLCAVLLAKHSPLRRSLLMFPPQYKRLVFNGSMK